MPQFAPCQSTLSPHIARGSPLITQFAVPPQVLHGSQCDKLPKEDFDGLCNLWFLHACIERGRLFAVGFALPKWIYMYAKGSGMHMVLTRLATQVSITGETYLF